MWHDVHSHPQQLDEADAAMKRALAGGVSCIVASTEKPSEAPAVLDLKQRFPEALHLAVGLHPATATILGEDAAREELRLLPSFAGEAAAVGEIGLDYKYAATPAERAFQRDVLEEQLRFAADRRLPVQLHSRRAQRPAMEAAIAFTRETGLPALLHWFTASRKLIRITNEHGVFVSVGPSVLYDEATRTVVATIRPDRLLLETDCPVPIGGEPNEPVKILAVAEQVALIHGMPLAEFAARMQENLAAYLYP
jgi:TatD DNase family protein